MKSGLLKENAGILSWVLRLNDIAMVIVAGLSAHWLRFGDLNLSADYRLGLLVGALVLSYIFQSFDMYRAWRGLSVLDELQSVLIRSLSVFLALALVAVLLKTAEQYSRIWFVYWAGFTLTFVSVSRVLVRIFLARLRRKGFNTRSVLLVGTGKQITRAARIITGAPWMGLTIIGYVNKANDVENIEVDALHRLGGIDNIPVIMQQHEVDQVWISTAFEHAQVTRDVLQSLKQETTVIRWLPDFFDFQLLNHSVSSVNGYPIINLSDSPIKGLARLAKWLEDKVLATLILIVISPLLLLIAIGVKLSSPGPVIFKQRRHGVNGKPMKIYKFRSMVVHEETASISQATKQDIRITPFGSFLRRSSLDELPQFFNVLQGRMSIVGPRPHALAHNQEYKELIDSYMRRHQVKPGITGWAQINGFRGETDTLEKMEMRVEADLYYINNWSIWFDLKIIFLTVFKGFFGKNAY